MFLPVCFGSIDADVQGGSHFFVCLSFGQQLENLAPEASAIHNCLRRPSEAGRTLG
jgi:hypothetical protein